MALLPDPRRYAACATDEVLVQWAQKSAAGDDEARSALLSSVRERLGAGRDDELLGALRRVPSATVGACLWELVCRAVDEGDAADHRGVVARIFAFPVLLVAAARESAVLPGTLPDMDEIRALLERHGALGATRNFGLGNALVTKDALEAVKPSVVYRWTRDWSGPPRDLPPAAIRLRHRGREEVHLRFIVGAGITPAEAPSLVETASNIGAWGLPLARALVRQLAQPGPEVLALPRPPLSLLRAPLAGRWAEIDTAWHLFVSNTVREFRASVGEPTVRVSAHEEPGGMGEVRVSMSSALDDTVLEGFRWPLHPFDDLRRIETVIAELLRECRVNDVRFVPERLPERLRSGHLFLRAGDTEERGSAH
jgi:hypothetical protein